jgi:hypothetical protein
MIHPDLFPSFVAPAIFFSAASLTILSINVRQMGIVTRLRDFHRKKHEATMSNKKQEALLFQSQIDSIEPRVRKIRNAFLSFLIGIIGVLFTSLLLGLATYLPDAFVIAVITFVCSVGAMIIGSFFYAAEILVSLSSEREEEQFYALLETTVENK